jgi:hypothetical protein
MGYFAFFNNDNQLGVIQELSNRSKNIINDITEMKSEKIFDLCPIRYIDTREYNHKQLYGLSMQEVNKVLPELIGYNKEGMPARIIYSHLRMFVLNEIKKQHILLQQQQLAIDQQQKMLDELYVEFEMLKSAVSN